MSRRTKGRNQGIDPRGVTGLNSLATPPCLTPPTKSPWVHTRDVREVFALLILSKLRMAETAADIDTLLASPNEEFLRQQVTRMCFGHDIRIVTLAINELVATNT